MLLAGGPLALLVVTLLGLAYWFLDPVPPKTVVLATGPEDSAYAEWGRRYAKELEQRGFTVTLKTTDGSVENLKLLRATNSGVDLAFVRNGAGATSAPVGSLLSLGGLFQEPVWVFYRLSRVGKLAGHSLADFSGLRMNIGEPGSGVPQLMRQLLTLNELGKQRIQLTEFPDNVAIGKMFEGKLDAVALVSAPESPLIQMLLISKGIGLLSMDQAQAYARRLPQVQPVNLPRGIVDLARNVPSSDVDLVASTTMLVAKKETHPALRQLFVQAAERLHRAPGWFQAQGQFPTRRDSELPIDAEADRFFTSGEPLLQRYLPFGVANLVDRMLVVLVSLLAVFLPLSRIVPPIYVFRIRSRIFRWYGRLREIEETVAQGQGDPEALGQELDELEAHLEQLQVPLAYADELYSLRSHVMLVRRKIRPVEKNIRLGSSRLMPGRQGPSTASVLRVGRRQA